MELITFLKLSEKLEHKRQNRERQAMLGILYGCTMDNYDAEVLEDAQDFLQYAADYTDDLEGAEQLARRIGNHLRGRAKK